MNAHFFDFAKQNQKNGHSFKMFLGGVSSQGSFETGSVGLSAVHYSLFLRGMLLLYICFQSYGPCNQ
jgi:hypothetical protein